MRKFLIILALALPAMVFAQGDIVAYLPNYRNAPTDEQLKRLTHLVLFSITPGDGGTVSLPSGGWARNVSDVVNNAHAKNVKVIIALGGWGKTGSFVESVQAANRQTFVNNIVAMVNANNFDGVDIDWEYPTSPQEVSDFEGFMVALKAALGPNKRLSFAIGAQYEPSKYTVATYTAMDALHLMTYDMSGSGGHSNETKAKQILDNWINSGKIAKEKVFLGVPFYGRTPETTYSDIIKDNQAVLSQQNQSGTIYYDGIPTIKSKTRYAYEQGAGGIMIWELGQDVAVTSPYSLLNAIYEQTQALKPVTPTSYKISVTITGGGTVKNGNNTVASKTQIDVQKDGDLTLTFTANSGYETADVKINGTSDNAAKTSGTYKFSGVNSSQSIEIIFAKRHVIPTTFNSGEYSSKSTEIVYNDDEHGKYVGGLNNNSFLEYLVSVPKTGNYKISMKAAVGANGQWGRAEISIYESNSTTALGKIAAPVGEDWYNFVAADAVVALSQGNKTLRLVSSGPVNIENITISIEEETPPNSIAQSKTKTVSSVGVSVVNGNINMSLPVSANSANIVLFDVRGKILFERNVAVNANFASVALPKSFLRNQAAILQVKTNSGFNMTKRILIK
jgi:hypothetical protein